jgi:hypothetical protein
MARRLGRSMAYIHHDHRPERSTVPEGPLQPYRELAALKTKLSIKRVFHRPHHGPPPMPGWENFYVRRIAYLKQVLRERTR